MLDDRRLLAPSCYHLPPTLDPLKVFRWLCHLDFNLTTEIFTLSNKSVFYEMAIYCLQQPQHRRMDIVDSNRLAALTRYFSDCMRRFEHQALLNECQHLFANHLEAGLNCIRFLPALERLLPADPDGQPASTEADNFVQSASRSASLLSSDGPPAHCAVEEVDRERWAFRDVDDEIPERLVHQSSCMSSSNTAGSNILLHCGAEAKLAHGVTLFVWATVRLLSRRIEMLQEFPEDHPLFVTARAPELAKVSLIGDCFETLLNKTKNLFHTGLSMYYQGEWRGAQEVMSRAITMSPEGDDGKVFFYRFRAECHFQMQELGLAVEDCTATLSYNPTSFAALLLRAQSYEALGQLDLAIEDIMQLCRLYPGSSQGQECRTRLAAAFSITHLSKPISKTALRLMDSEVPRRDLASTPPSMLSPRSPYGMLPDFPGSPNIVSSTSPTTFASAQYSNLATLPAFPDPVDVDDTPHLSAFLESGADLDFTVCGGKELGRGASGMVYKAVHPWWGWFVAVKEVSSKELESEDVMSTFERLVSMRHNHIVRCLGVRRLPGFYHIVMEFCSGGTLRSLIDDVRGLSSRLMRKYATEILLGLRYIHGHGLLHRDIKGSNILLRDDGTAKIADFGTSMRIPEREPTTCGPVKGTVLWMAPETFRGRYCTASDVWSFGCVLIEMAIAKDPWHEQQFREQLTAMVFIATRPDALPNTPSQFSEEPGRHFFQCCIARDPSERCTADLLLRHPWLSSTEPNAPTTPSSSPCAGSIQGSLRDKDHGSDFQFTTCSSDSDDAFLETKTVAFLEALSPSAVK